VSSSRSGCSDGSSCAPCWTSAAASWVPDNDVNDDDNDDDDDDDDDDDLPHKPRCRWAEVVLVELKLVDDTLELLVEVLQLRGGVLTVHGPQQLVL